MMLSAQTMQQGLDALDKCKSDFDCGSDCKETADNACATCFAKIKNAKSDAWAAEEKASSSSSGSSSSSSSSSSSGSSSSSTAHCASQANKVACDGESTCTWITTTSACSTKSEDSPIGSSRRLLNYIRNLASVSTVSTTNTTSNTTTTSKKTTVTKTYPIDPSDKSKFEPILYQNYSTKT